MANDLHCDDGEFHELCGCVGGDADLHCQWCCEALTVGQIAALESIRREVSPSTPADISKKGE